MSVQKLPGLDQVISGAGGIPSAEAVGTPTIWLSANFAPFWFQDAVAESRNKDNGQARRREILFSVAAAESYLLEWVRDTVLSRNFQKLDHYFPPEEKRPITEKWKAIPKELAADGLIKAAPELCGETWQHFVALVQFRNGLIHARASRPQTFGLPEALMPLPSMAQLESLQGGWAVGVVASLIRELNSAADTAPPNWLA